MLWRDGVQLKIREPLLGSRRGSHLVIAFQAAFGNDPEELFGSQGFGFSVDPDGQVAVFFADVERKDLLQVQEEADDIPSLFVVNWFDVAPVVLRFFEFSVRIVENEFSRRGADQDLSTTGGNEREGCP